MVEVFGFFTWGEAVITFRDVLKYSITAHSSRFKLKVKMLNFNHTLKNQNLKNESGDKQLLILQRVHVVLV